MTASDLASTRSASGRCHWKRRGKTFPGGIRDYVGQPQLSKSRTVNAHRLRPWCTGGSAVRFGRRFLAGIDRRLTTAASEGR